MSADQTIQNYIIYLTEASGSSPAGLVINNILYDGVQALSLPSGQALQADPSRKYPVGSTYKQS